MEKDIVKVMAILIIFLLVIELLEHYLGIFGVLIAGFSFVIFMEKCIKIRESPA